MCGRDGKCTQTPQKDSTVDLIGLNKLSTVYSGRNT